MTPQYFVALGGWRWSWPADHLVHCLLDVVERESRPHALSHGVRALGSCADRSLAEVAKRRIRRRVTDGTARHASGQVHEPGRRGSYRFAHRCANHSAGDLNEVSDVFALRGQALRGVHQTTLHLSDMPCSAIKQSACRQLYRMDGGHWTSSADSRCACEDWGVCWVVVPSDTATSVPASVRDSLGGAVPIPGAH